MSFQPLEMETLVAATLDQAWEAWTTDAGLRRFLADRTNVELRIGGPFEVYFAATAPPGSRGSEGCRILSYLPQEMLSFSWNAPPQFSHARQHRTWVVICFRAMQERSTRIRLTHLGWAEKRAEFPEHAAEWESVREYFVRAWHVVLDRLRLTFE